MSLNATPRGDRIHIALFGKRNAGKSSVINAMTNQELAIVSDVKGTTTDPVYKAMELLPLGPVVMIDTPGLDDEGELGEKRVKKAKEVLGKADIALVIVDATAGMTEFEEDMIRLIEDRKIPYLKVYNKMDLSNAQEWKEDKACFVSAKDKKGIWELKEEIGKLVPTDDDTLKIVGDLVCPNDFVILVVPIDSAAPKGRLILPQQQTIRDLLEAGAASIVVRETELEKTLEEIGKKPALVITDSQAFGKVSKIVPEDIKLTSFSILFARYKGDLEEEVRGVKALEHLEEGAKILIAEGCTHHRQCDDIGTVKIPRWLKQYTGKDFDIHTSSGNSFPEDLDTYDLVIHCGGCTLNRREMKNRIARVKDAGVPIVNYGIFIAATQGILKRTLEPFEEASRILNEIHREMDFDKILSMVKTRIELFTEIPGHIDFFEAVPEYDVEMYKHKKMKTTPETSLTVLKEIYPVIEAQEDFTNDALYEMLVSFAKGHEYKNGYVMWPVRTAVSGKQMTPGGATELMELLGKEESLKRINDAIAKLEAALA